MKVGVSFSGGLDSMVLAYEVLQRYDDVTLLTGTSTGWIVKKHYRYGDTYFTQDIVLKLEEKLGKKIKHELFPAVYFGHGELNEEMQVGRVAELLYAYYVKGKYDIVYLGNNAVPEELSQYPRYFNQYEGTHDFGKHKLEIKIPYKDILKDEIYRKVIDYEIEDIAKLTVSCAHAIPNYQCGECFGCREKRWAEEKTGVVL